MLIFTTDNMTITPQFTQKMKDVFDTYINALVANIEYASDTIDKFIAVTVDCEYITNLSQITSLAGPTITFGSTEPATATAGSLHLDSDGALYIATAADTWKLVTHA